MSQPTVGKFSENLSLDERTLDPLGWNPGATPAPKEPPHVAPPQRSPLDPRCLRRLRLPGPPLGVRARTDAPASRRAAGPRQPGRRLGAAHLHRPALLRRQAA